MMLHELLPFWTTKYHKLPKSLVTDSSRPQCNTNGDILRTTTLHAPRHYTHHDITRTTTSHKLWRYTNYNFTWTVMSHKLRGHTDLWCHELQRYMSVTKFWAKKSSKWLKNPVTDMTDHNVNHKLLISQN